MSFNGSGVFNINTAGQPVVTGTTISSTTFNNLTADLATGLTTTLTKDGQSTPTANIGLGTYKITNLGAGTVASDAARLDQVQGGAATFITVTGTDTLTGTVVPALSAYAAGNQFSFLVANTNTGAVTINVDGIGAKAITRTGTTALVAGDMVAGQAVEIIYDGTRFQLVNGNSFTNLKVSGTLGVTGVATFTAQPIASSLTASLPVFTDASKGLVSNTITGTGSVAMSASPTFTGTVGAVDVTTTGNTILGDASTDTLNVGNGGLVKDASGNVGIGTASPGGKLEVAGELRVYPSTTPAAIRFGVSAVEKGKLAVDSSSNMLFETAGAERMRIDSSGNLLVGTTSVLGKQTNAYDGVTAFGLALANTASGTAGQIAIRFMRNGSDVGSVTTTNVATAYNTSSDYRLKENVAPMTGALTTVSQLKPVTYTWKSDGSDGQGFIAHELQAIVPDCVSGAKDAVDAEGNPVHQGIDTSFLVATLTAAIQEQQTIINDLKARITALETK